MVKKVFFSVAAIFLTIMLNAQNYQAFSIYNAKGEKVQFEEIVENAGNKQVVLFGELHNNPISHWFELQIAKGVFHSKKQNLILGAEMFESDNQLNIDEYLTDLIGQKKFEADVRLWNNYQTDYKPLVNFAKENGLYFVASNVPRRYASRVHKAGGLVALDALSDDAKRYLPPLPIDYNAENKEFYESLFKSMMGGHISPDMQNTLPEMAQAQAIKDATMAYFIAKAIEKNKDATLIHYNGAGHSDNRAGIFIYLNKYAPNTQTLSISTVLQGDVSKLDDENMNKADYIIVVTSDMTTTY